MKTQKHTFLFNALMTVVCFVFLVTAATWLVLSAKPIYELQVRLFDIPEYSGFSRELCIRNYGTLIDYNMMWGPGVLTFPDLKMSVNGATHFREVKAIFVAMQYAAIVSGILLVIGSVYGRKKEAYGWQKAVVILSVTVVAVLGAAILFAGDETFLLMHKLLFRNDYWIFDWRTDPVILILPENLFLMDGGLILLVIALALAVFGISYRMHKNRTAGGRKARAVRKKRDGAKKGSRNAASGRGSGAKKGAAAGRSGAKKNAAAGRGSGQKKRTGGKK
ncbi:MAG: TIGR01906 family membrane protein [Lachnospiraceae bacterium]|nr:TIGR01906 family membrane protein [Lachnospiraceae bacterium]